MMRTINRLKLIVAICKNDLDLDQVGHYEPNDLLCFCAELEARQTPRSWYKGLIEIQKELLDDDRFFSYLEKLSKTTLPMPSINEFLERLHSEGDAAVNYSIDRLISSMAWTVLIKDIFCDYLKYFSDLRTNKNQKEVIVQNLRLRRDKLSKPLSELSEEERQLFLQPCLA